MILDTCVLQDVFNEKENAAKGAQRLLRYFSNQEIRLFISVVSLIELYSGALNQYRTALTIVETEKQNAHFQANRYFSFAKATAAYFFDSTIDIDARITKKWAAIWKQNASEYRLRRLADKDSNDVIIGATSEVFRMPVVTYNARDFKKMNLTLPVIDPSKADVYFEEGI